MTHRRVLSSLLFAALLSSVAFAQTATAPTKLDVMVPMRDEVQLATTVYLPEGDGPWPVVVSRTPYNKAGMERGSAKYTKNGYAYVTQDTRGKFASEGEYVPFATDRDDGYDTIAWINRQDFCNGNIGMSGGSALGITTNLAASSDPPGLKAAYVVVAPQSQFNQSTFINGVFKWSQVAGWMEAQGAGNQVAEVMSGVTMNESWRERDFIHFIDQVDIPMYNVGGWYDIFLQGNIDNFEYLQNRGKGAALGNQKLLMGPFGHGQLAGDLEYPGNGLADAEIRWFDYWLKGEKNGITEELPVRYFMMASARKGAMSDKNRWVESETWPPPHKKTRLYLNNDGQLTWEEPHDHIAPTSYAFDPTNPVPTFGGSNLLIDKGPMDQRAVGEREDYLRFETPTLEEDVVITGPVTMELWASTDGPDTDFMVKLVDVYPDGYEALVLDNPIRARFRKGRNPEDVAMMIPGQPEKLVIDLWSTAITFEKGHKIAVHVTSSNYPRFDVNPNTGVPAMQSRVATNAIHHDAEHPSAIVLPISAP